MVEIIERKEVKKALIKTPGSIRKQYQIWYRLVSEHGSKIVKDFPGYRLEKLSGPWIGFLSIRLNKEWRVIYRVDEVGAIEVVTVFRLSLHDYRAK